MKEQKIQTLITALILAIAVMIPAYSGAQTKPQSCSNEKGCVAGLQCTKFPEGRRCAKPNPCSYYQCPQGTKCEVTVIHKSGDFAVPAPQPEGALEAPQLQALTPQSSLSSPTSLPSSPTSAQEGQQKASPVFSGQPTTLPTDEGTVSVFVGCWSGSPPIAQPSRALKTPHEQAPVPGQEFELIYISPEESRWEDILLGGPEIPRTGGSDSGGTTSSGVSNTVVETGRVIGPVGEVRVASPNPSPAPISVWKSKTTNKTIFQTQSAAAEYAGVVSVENDKLTIETPQGKQTIEATPDTAVAQVQDVMKSTEIEIKKIELKADIETGAPSYQVRTEESTKLFWFVPVTIKAETQVSAKTGEITSVKRPWWRVFAW